MKMSNKIYDICKWFLMVFVPALILLISTLGTIYHFDTEIITLTIGAFATFLASLLGLSNYNYKKGDE
jgi:hypothetical protein